MGVSATSSTLSGEVLVVVVVASSFDEDEELEDVDEVVDVRCFFSAWLLDDLAAVLLGGASLDVLVVFVDSAAEDSLSLASSRISSLCSLRSLVLASRDAW